MTRWSRWSKNGQRRWARASGGARRGTVVALVCVALLVATVGAVSAAPLARRFASAPIGGGGKATHSPKVPPGFTSAAQAQAWASDGAWFQQMILLYASGDPSIQRMALATGAQAGLSVAQVASIAQATRATWVTLMRADPASLGRVGARPNRPAQATALGAFRQALQRIAGARLGALLAATARAAAQVSAPQWQAAHTPRSQIAFHGGRYIVVYATAFSIPGDPLTEQYVALPDAYLKFADLGWASSIPAPYQSVYIVNTSSPQYTVDVISATGVGYAVSRANSIPIYDVGPWNEDDNWWDPTNTTATVAADCPLATTQLSGALGNAQVDGACPGAQNWRRIAYYLLYQHAQLPFFQTAAYAPTGPFTNGANWPTTLPQGCPEAAFASVNNDIAPCGVNGYNANNGAWLRDGSYNSPILNEAGIDLSPATDSSLGWVWPSSGYVFVNVERLP